MPHRERITPLTAITRKGSRSLDCLEEVVLKLDSPKGSYHRKVNTLRVLSYGIKPLSGPVDCVATVLQASSTPGGGDCTRRIYTEDRIYTRSNRPPQGRAATYTDP